MCLLLSITYSHTCKYPFYKGLWSTVCIIIHLTNSIRLMKYTKVVSTYILYIFIHMHVRIYRNTNIIKYGST